MRLSPSGIGLIIANAIPACGVLFMGWDLFPVVLLYWLENGVIGLINVLKMLVNQSREPAKLGQKLFMIPFFCMHYGGFFMVHGVFVLDVFGGRTTPGVAMPTFHEVLGLVSRHGLTFALLTLILSHAVSFSANYIRRGEWKDLLLVELMFAPYRRVVVLHLFILGSAFLIQFLGAPRLSVLLLVVLKTAADLIAHNFEHSKQLSRLKVRMRKLYEETNSLPAEPSDPIRLRHGDYTRDARAERRYDHSYNIGCIASLAIFVSAFFIVQWLGRWAGLSLLILGLILGIASLVIYNLRKTARCSTCGKPMEAVMVDVPARELNGWEKLACFVGANGETYLKHEDSDSPTTVVRVEQRWFVCPGCKSYFLGRKRVHEKVAQGDHDVEAFLSHTTEWISGSENETGDHAPSLKHEGRTP